MDFGEVIDVVGGGVDGAGVAVTVVGMLIASAGFVRDLRRQQSMRAAHRTYRHGLGRSILLGLEFLIAGDIIRTVAVDPSFNSVGVLAAVVAVRTFLSFALELELNGRWPWQPPVDDVEVVRE